jgi:hypothetical protein
MSNDPFWNNETLTDHHSIYRLCQIFSSSYRLKGIQGIRISIEIYTNIYIYICRLRNRTSHQKFLMDSGIAKNQFINPIISYMFVWLLCFRTKVHVIISWACIWIDLISMVGIKTWHVWSLRIYIFSIVIVIRLFVADIVLFIWYDYRFTII